MHLQKRVLVTGGAGFLGSFLCDRLLREGCEVICCDNFFTGTKRNIVHLLNHPAFELIRHDITFPLYIEVDEIYNLGNPGEFTILDLAEKVIRLTGSRSKIVFKPLPVDDPTQRCPDIERAREKLGWQPAIDLEEGLARTIDYFRNLLRS
jgi:nucleoside-diphosphate-sugar epimerase